MATTTIKVTQQKDKDFDQIVPRSGYCDISEEEKKNEIIEICRESYKMKHDGELKYYKDMAENVKIKLDQTYKGSWHVIVGTNFGSFVSYEVKHCYLFWLEHIGFLVWKHG